MPVIAEKPELCNGCVRQGCSPGFIGSEQGPKSGSCLNRIEQGGPRVPDQPVPFNPARIGQGPPTIVNQSIRTGLGLPVY